VVGTHSAPPLSLAAMSMTALANLGSAGSNGGGNHLNLLSGGPNDSGSSNGALSLSAANTLQPSISALNISSNSTSSLSSQQQQQATAPTPAQTPGSKGQPGSVSSGILLFSYSVAKKHGAARMKKQRQTKLSRHENMSRKAVT